MSMALVVLEIMNAGVQKNIIIMIIVIILYLMVVMVLAHHILLQERVMFVLYVWRNKIIKFNKIC